MGTVQFRCNVKAFMKYDTTHLFSISVPVISAQYESTINEINTEHLRYDFV